MTAGPSEPDHSICKPLVTARTLAAASRRPAVPRTSRWSAAAPPVRSGPEWPSGWPARGGRRRVAGVGVAGVGAERACSAAMSGRPDHRRPVPRCRRPPAQRQVCVRRFHPAARAPSRAPAAGRSPPPRLPDRAVRLPRPWPMPSRTDHRPVRIHGPAHIVADRAASPDRCPRRSPTSAPDWGSRCSGDDGGRASNFSVSHPDRLADGTPIAQESHRFHLHPRPPSRRGVHRHSPTTG